MQKILISGATGYIGIEVSKLLSASGKQPRLMVHRPLRGIMLRRLDAETVEADLRHPRSLQRALRGVDTVIHLGARAAFTDYRTLYPSIVKGSINFIQASIAAGVRHFVYAGTLLVYPGAPSPIGQQTPAEPRSGYGTAKLQAERVLQRMARQAGMRFVSLRLPHVYGAHSLLFDQIRRGRIIFPGRGTNHFAHLHVHDAARALIRAAETDLAGVYVIGDDQPCSWNAFFQTAQKCYPRLRVIHLPRALALFGAGLLDIGFRLTARPNPWPRRAVKNWNLNLPVLPGTVKTVLAMNLTFPSIETGLPAALEEALPIFWRPSNLDPI